MCSRQLCADVVGQVRADRGVGVEVPGDQRAEIRRRSRRSGAGSAATRVATGSVGAAVAASTERLTPHRALRAHISPAHRRDSRRRILCAAPNVLGSPRWPQWSASHLGTGRAHRARERTRAQRHHRHLRRPDRARRRQPDRRDPPGPRRDRPQRRRQDDAVQRRLRLRPARHAATSCAAATTRRAPAPRRPAGPRHGAHPAGTRALRPDDGAGQRHGRRRPPRPLRVPRLAARAAPRRRATSGPCATARWASSTTWAWRRTPTATRRACPTRSASGSRWPARSSPSPTCCCSTSRPAACRPPRWTSSATSSRRWPSRCRCCSSSTTWTS